MRLYKTTTPRRCLSRLISTLKFHQRDHGLYAFSCNDHRFGFRRFRGKSFRIYFIHIYREWIWRSTFQSSSICFRMDKKKKKKARRKYLYTTRIWETRVVTRREIKLGLMELHVTRIQGRLEDKQVESSSRYYKTASDLTSKNNLFRGDNRVTKNC